MRVSVQKPAVLIGASSGPKEGPRSAAVPPTGSLGHCAWRQESREAMELITSLGYMICAITAAVHRLVAGYREGIDVQTLLVSLSVYLGHVDLSATQRYLTVIPELREKACLRFARYALGGYHE